MEAMEFARRESRTSRSSALYKSLAMRVTFQRCSDPAFLKLRRILAESVVYTVYAPTGIDAPTVQRHLQTIQQNVMLIAPEARVELSQVFGAS